MNMNAKFFTGIPFVEGKKVWPQIEGFVLVREGRGGRREEGGGSRLEEKQENSFLW
jgi:hypothetical protein